MLISGKNILIIKKSTETGFTEVIYPYSMLVEEAVQILKENDFLIKYNKNKDSIKEINDYGAKGFVIKIWLGLDEFMWVVVY